MECTRGRIEEGTGSICLRGGNNVLSRESTAVSEQLTLLREPHSELLHPEPPLAVGSPLHEEYLAAVVAARDPAGLADEALKDVEVGVAAAGVRVQQAVLLPLAQALVLALWN